MALGLVAVSLGSFVALVGTTWTFAITSVLVVLGVAHVTVGGHAYISARVGYERRARAIGMFETSWALSLLVGAPIIALLIATIGWRGPYAVLAVGTAAMAAVLLRLVPATAAAGRDASDGRDASVRRSRDARVWLTICGSAAVAMAGLSMFAVTGAWLDDAFDVPTGGLGAVAMGFGAIELVSSLSSASFADRAGKRRTTLAAIVLLVIGLLVIAAADSTLAVGVIGLLAFLCGFEYAIVTSFSLVSEAMPSARGSTLALANAIGTLARGIGVVTGGWLYGRWGIEATASLSAGAATVSFACFALGGRLDR